MAKVEIKKEKVDRRCFIDTCGEKSVGIAETKDGHFTFHVPFCDNPDHKKAAKERALWFVH